MTNTALETAMRHEFSAAKLAWVLVLLLQSFGLGIALFGVFLTVPAVLAIGGAVAVPILTVVLRGAAKTRCNAGEHFRRALVRSDGWGLPVPSTMLLRSIAEGPAVPSWDPPAMGTYYSSPYPPGPRRVAHIVEQSSFFTLRHARTAALACAIVLLGGAVVGAGLVWAVAYQATAAEQLAKGASAILSFAVASEFLGLFLSYRGLAVSARSTLDRCGELAHDQDPAVPDVAFAVAAYDCSLASSPPIPGLIYRMQRARLEREWQAHEAADSVAEDDDPHHSRT